MTIPRVFGTMIAMLSLCGVLVLRQASVAQDAAVAGTDDPQAVLKRMGNRGIMVHDPSTIVKCKDEYWTFITGRNTPSFHSKDLVNWTSGPRANTRASSLGPSRVMGSAPLLNLPMCKKSTSTFNFSKMPWKYSI